MKTIITKIPIGLIYSRLVLGLVVLTLSILQPQSYKILIVVCMIWAIVSDIFDGIIARKLAISTPKLRRLDSSIDQIFWMCTLIGAVLICFDFFLSHLWEIGVILFLEAVTYFISFLRFKKEVATHAILSKFWALSVLGTLIQIVLYCDSTYLFSVCVYLGIVTRIEIIAILLVLRHWTSDVPSLYHAIMLRKGKEIKRYKLFNG